MEAQDIPGREAGSGVSHCARAEGRQAVDRAQGACRDAGVDQCTLLQGPARLVDPWQQGDEAVVQREVRISSPRGPHLSKGLRGVREQIMLPLGRRGWPAERL